MFLYNKQNKLEFRVFICVTTERPSILLAIHILLGKFSFCRKDELARSFMSFSVYSK